MLTQLCLCYDCVFMVYLVFVASRTIRMIHRMSRSDVESETETLRPVYEFSFFLECDIELKF